MFFTDEEIQPKPFKGTLPKGLVISATQHRYVIRQRNFKHRYGLAGWWIHGFWWFVHNVPVHVVLGLIPCRATFRLHDWASRRLNHP